MTRLLMTESGDFSAGARRILDALCVVDYCQLTRGEVLQCAHQYDVLWVRLGINVDRDLLQKCSRLRAIVTPTTGLDHIDCEEAQRRGIAILSLRGEREFLQHVPATAELTWGLALSLTRRIPWATQAVCQGNWDRNLFRGHDLRGKSLGIVGLGRLGIQVARFGLAFGMEVACFDPYQELVPAEIYRCHSLMELLSSCDVTSLHVPLNEETVGLIGANELAGVRPQSILINTSRGDIVDGAALLEALQAGRLAAAALDVVPGERESASATRNALLQYAATHDNLLITPHIGGATWESMAATEEFMAVKLGRFLSAAEARRASA